MDEKRSHWQSSPHLKADQCLDGSGCKTNVHQESRSGTVQSVPSDISEDKRLLLSKMSFL